jgi:hypothetical protein
MLGVQGMKYSFKATSSVLIFLIYASQANFIYGHKSLVNTLWNCAQLAKRFNEFLQF